MVAVCTNVRLLSIEWMEPPTPQGPVTVDHFGARFLTSDADASHILYTISVGTGAGTWAFALQ